MMDVELNRDVQLSLHDCSVSFISFVLLGQTRDAALYVMQVLYLSKRSACHRLEFLGPVLFLFLRWSEYASWVLHSSAYCGFVVVIFVRTLQALNKKADPENGLNLN